MIRYGMGRYLHMHRHGIWAPTFALSVMLAAQSAHAIDTNLRDYVCEKLDDFTAKMVVVKADQRELGKISRDAGFLYRFHEVTMSYKEPNKVRIEGSLDGAKGLYIVNGPIQWVAIPKIHLQTRRDFGNAPGKRKSLMDVGLISEYYLTYTDGQFVREANVEGTPCAVFRLQYKDRDDTSHQMVYIDPRTKVVRKREAYSQTGKLQAIYYYKDVKQVAPGIWFPTRIEVQNTDRVIAGITEYRDIRVNVGLSDREFTL